MTLTHICYSTLVDTRNKHRQCSPRARAFSGCSLGCTCEDIDFEKVRQYMRNNPKWLSANVNLKSSKFEQDVLFFPKGQNSCCSNFCVAIEGLVLLLMGRYLMARFVCVCSSFILSASLFSLPKHSNSPSPFHRREVPAFLSWLQCFRVYACRVHPQAAEHLHSQARIQIHVSTKPPLKSVTLT